MYSAARLGNDDLPMPVFFIIPKYTLKTEVQM